MGGLLGLVHAVNRLEQARVETVLFESVDQGADVLGQARAAVAGGGGESPGADSRIQPDAAGQLAHVGSELFAEARQGVHEGNPARQHGVGGVLDELSGPGVDLEKRTVPGEVLVELAQQLE